MKYDLVFEGGGAKGMVFVGACETFFKHGHTFGRLLGTSAGAITALLLAAGYTPEEMLAALIEKGPDGKSAFAGFMGPPTPFTDQELQQSATLRFLEAVDFTFLPDFAERRIHQLVLKALAANDGYRHVLGLVERGGWFAADQFVSWLIAKMDTGRCGDAPRAFSKMTFAQFYAATKVDLSIVASDTTEQSILVLNHNTAPNCPIVWGVRMSMSIPLLWNEVIWKEEWGQYGGKEMAGHAIVDGGMLSNFPIELFISDAPQVTRLMGAKSKDRTMGLLIDEKLPVPAAAKLLGVKINIKPGELATLQRLKRLIDTATGAHDKMIIDEYSNLVVRLPAEGYGTTEFDMSDDRRKALVEAGRNAMATYLEGGEAPGGLVLPSKAPVAGVRTTADRIAVDLLNQAF